LQSSDKMVLYFARVYVIEIFSAPNPVHIALEPSQAILPQIATHGA